jgi:hypothetical protein
MALTLKQFIATKQPCPDVWERTRCDEDMGDNITADLYGEGNFLVPVLFDANTDDMFVRFDGHVYHDNSDEAEVVATAYQVYLNAVGETDDAETLEYFPRFMKKRKSAL